MKMKHSIAKIALLAAACGGVAFAGQSAQADSILNLMQPGSNHFSDETAQGYATNVTNNGDPLSQGDILRGYVNFGTLNTVGANIGGATVNDELSGVFRIKVLTDTTNANGSHTYTFGPDANWNFADSTLDTANNSDGAMVLLFEDASPGNADFSSEATAAATATDGSLFMAIGFTGANGTAAGGQGWTATGDPNFSAAALLNPGTQIATANFALDRVSNQGIAGSIALVDQIWAGFSNGPAEIIGSSTIRGNDGSGAIGSEFVAGGNTDFTLVTPVPTPAALGMGLALMGFMGMRRRRQA